MPNQNESNGRIVEGVNKSDILLSRDTKHVFDALVLQALHDQSSNRFCTLSPTLDIGHDHLLRDYFLADAEVFRSALHLRPKCLLTGISTTPRLSVIFEISSSNCSASKCDAHKA
jgi:hypothetical protein